jgi:hypothetical protein
MQENVTSTDEDLSHSNYTFISSLMLNVNLCNDWYALPNALLETQSVEVCGLQLSLHRALCPLSTCPFTYARSCYVASNCIAVSEKTQIFKNFYVQQFT